MNFNILAHDFIVYKDLKKSCLYDVTRLFKKESNNSKFWWILNNESATEEG